MPYCRKNYADAVGLNTVMNSVWLTIITMTSVGYGDIVPDTAVGKVVAMFTAVLGAAMVSLMVLVLTNMLGFDSGQKLAFHHINKRRSAAIVI